MQTMADAGHVYQGGPYEQSCAFGSAMFGAVGGIHKKVEEAQDAMGRALSLLTTPTKRIMRSTAKYTRNTNNWEDSRKRN